MVGNMGFYGLILDGSRYRDSDTWPEIYMLFSDWKAPQISSRVSNLRSWKTNTHPSGSLIVYRQVP